MDKKQMILDEAEILFAEKGYYGLGLIELLSKCDVPKGSFYYYFPNGKIQLIQEALWDSYQKMENGINRKFFSKDNALEAFQSMTLGLEQGIREKKHLQSLLLSMISIESVYLNEEVNAACKEIYERWQKLYADKLVDYGYSAEDSLIKSQAIFALVHGSLISSWIKQDPSDLSLARKNLSSILNS